MKIRINVNTQLWDKFRDKVRYAHLILDDVVTQLVEPALQAYLDPPIEMVKTIPPSGETMELMERLSNPQELPILDRITPLKQAPPPTATRRCELCDNPSERLYAHQTYRVCYACWKAAITAIPVPTPPAPPEAA